MGAIAFVVVRATDGAISLGTVLMAVSLIRRSRTQLASAAQGSGGLVSTLATADRLFWLRTTRRSRRRGRNEPHRRSGCAMASALRDVDLRLSGHRTGLSSTASDFELPAGSTVALVGENGSGKTTLIKLLLGMYRPDGGTILVDGVSLAELDPAAWRERARAAFQDFARFHLPAVESIGVADLPALDDEPAAPAALDRAGAGTWSRSCRTGWPRRSAPQFTGGHGLSGGQWQKLALGARCAGTSRC